MTNRRQGYSLFEVLVAFTVMALVLAVLLPGQARLFRRSIDGTEALLAADYAASRLDRIGIDLPLAPAHREIPYRGWRVREEITLASQADGAVGTYVVRIEVHGPDGGALLARVESLKVAP